MCSFDSDETFDSKKDWLHSVCEKQMSSPVVLVSLGEIADLEHQFVSDSWRLDFSSFDLKLSLSDFPNVEKNGIKELRIGSQSTFLGTYSNSSYCKLEEFSELNFALNEVTIARKNTTSMISIDTKLDNKHLNSYWADGLIISTPTGSTGYSLSCGGPIVMPGSNNFIITPIAPHNLNVRPLVISDEYELKVKVEGRANQFLIALDSRIETIDSSIELTIKKECFKINMIETDTQDFASTLRNKLLWGLDKRN